MKIILLLITCMFSITANAQTERRRTTEELIREMNDFYKGSDFPRDSALYMAAANAYEDTRKTFNRSMFIFEYIRNDVYEKRNRLEDEKRIAYMNKKYGANIAKKLLAGETWLGMKDNMVKDAFGSANIKITTTAQGKTETWYYWGDRPPHETDVSTATQLSYAIVIRNHIVIAFIDL